MKQLFIVLLWIVGNDDTGSFWGEVPVLAFHQEDAIKNAIHFAEAKRAGKVRWFGTIKTAYKGVLDEPGNS